MPTILAILSAVAQMRNLFNNNNNNTSFSGSTPNYYQNNNTDVQGWLGIPFKK